MVGHANSTITEQIVIPKEDQITISTEEYNELLNESLFLQALIACGVDNWDSYSDAQEMLEELES
jgi:hypothetical protein